jgi:hypothetical protein
LIARDEKNDLAVVRSKTPISSVTNFRAGAPVRAGDAVVALGYPLSGVLATAANLSVGNVSALAGLGDDSRYLQISAPVQPGNSGGPLLDASGHLVGIVTAKLNAVRIARFTGDIPQNVNFALKGEVARTFLDSKGIAYQTARSEQQLSPADVGEIARPFTVKIECEHTGSRPAALSNKPSPTPKPSAPTSPVPAPQREFNAQADIDVRVGVYVNVRSDCTVGPLPDVRLTTPPEHGTVSVKQSSLTLTNYKQCLAAEVPAIVAIYRAATGYTGTDVFELQVSSQGGQKQLQQIQMTVSPTSGAR